MLVGYARVSKSDGSQTLDLQRDALVAAGVEPAHIYEDLASGRSDSRPGFMACIKALRPGDQLTVWKLDRLSRNLSHLVTTVDALNKRDVALRVLTGAAIDTTTPQGKLMFGLFATLAEFERDLIAERTRAGLAAARARGRFGGRPAKLSKSDIQLAAAALKDRETNVSALCEMLKISRKTLYRHVSPTGELRGPIER